MKAFWFSCPVLFFVFNGAPSRALEGANGDSAKRVSELSSHDCEEPLCSRAPEFSESSRKSFPCSLCVF